MRDAAYVIAVNRVAQACRDMDGFKTGYTCLSKHFDRHFFPTISVS